MKRLWCLLLVAAFSFCFSCVGCGPSAVDQTGTDMNAEEEAADQEQINQDEMVEEEPGQE